MDILKEMVSGRKMILQLAKNDFKSKFAGSFLGILWAFAQPIVIVSIYWVVFEKGLKSQPLPELPNLPYLLWLIAGMCPWFYFNDALNTTTNCLIEYSYIVKKVKFNVDTIPVVKIASATFVHLFFILLINIVFAAFGYMPTVFTLQVFYYSIAVFVMSLGISYLTSAINVFFRDMTQIVGILLQYVMWIVPVMIPAHNYPDFVFKTFRFNPIYYIIEGYRDAMIRNIWFWDKPGETLYFWCFVAVVFVLGRVVFGKLKPHFADVM